VKLPIDENLPPRLADLLTEAGHPAVHVRDLDAAGSPDPQIIDLALTEARAIVSADSDFGALLASTGATEPSVILVRESSIASRRSSPNFWWAASSSSRPN
jgi:predicted nuclease of predicted toxin-antitoxin system